MQTQATTIQGFRLSPQQKHLWLQQGEGDGAAYTAIASVRVGGPLDRQKLTAALQELVERHEILRTTFEALPGMDIPLQVVHETVDRPVALRAIDLGHLAEVERQQALATQQQALAEAPLRLDRLPIVDFTVIQWAEQQHQWLIRLPALCCDRLSLERFVRELGQLYSASLGPSALTDEPFQYIDFSEWQHELFDSDEAAIGRRFWQQQDRSALAVCPPLLRLPQGQPFQPRAIPLDLEPADVAALEAIAQAEEATVSDVLLAIWRILFWRTTGVAAAIGVSTDGRNYEELEDALGLFAKVLPVSCPLTATDSLRDVVRRSLQASRETAQWQESFTWEEAAGGGADIGESFYPLSFTASELPAPRSAGPLSLEIEAQSSYSDRFCLQLQCLRSTGSLHPEIHYDTAACTPEAIASLVEQFQSLLQGAIAEPDRAIASLSLLSERQRQQVLVRFNDTTIAYSENDCIHHLFEQQVARTPDAPALMCEGDSLTFAQLNARANQLARYLQGREVGPEIPVGLWLPRSLDCIVAMLGILKAGGAYVPFDPGLPAAALSVRLQAVRPALLLTHSSLVESVSEIEIPVLCLDRDWDIASIPKDDLDPTASPDNLAYILFTSGSTGVPKGVEVTHRNLCNYLQGIAPKLDITPQDRFATVSTFAADLGNTVIFPALCRGGCLHVITQERLADPDALADYCRQEAIDYLKIVPSHLAALLEATNAASILPKKCLVLGGEASHWSDIDRLRELAPSCRILNHYGPTESTVGVLTYPVPEVSSGKASDTVPLGRPLGNIQLYVLDEHFEPVPTGIAGELYIAGAGLARGYFNRPELTAAAFLPNPWSDRPGDRLYKTGDRVCYLPDGTLVFLGRSDRQVKIRGFRIELGEIETTLSHSADIRDCIARVTEETPGLPQLVAYLRCDRPESVSIADLKQFAQQQLPDVMVPAAFVLLEQFPRTPNGKVDLQALPAPSSLASASTYVQPRTDVEQSIAQILSQLLKVERVGLEDNFFALGGHSLLATQAISRLRRAFEVELPLAALFEQPSVAGLAQAIETLMRQDRALDAPPLVAVKRQSTMPLSYAQQRLWLLDRLEPNRSTYSIPFTLRLSGKLDLSALERSFNAIARRHEVWRTTFAEVEGKPVQTIAPYQPRSLPVVDLQPLPAAQRNDEVERLVAQAARMPFDLATGPLVRVTIFKLSATESIALFNTHHIIFDAWSRAIVLRELAAFYTAFTTGREVPLPELPIQYADFAVWQRQWLQGEGLEQLLKYWHQQLAGAPSLLELPTDRPRPALQTYRGDRHVDLLPIQLRDELLELGRSEGATLFGVLMAAYQVLLCRYANCSDIVVGIPIANRSRAELEGTIGFFTNTLAIRTDLTALASFRAVLQRVRQVALEAYTHQDLPFEQLLETLPIERQLSHSPVFQVAISLQNTPKAELQLPGLILSPVETEVKTAKFDLSLLMEETEAGIFAAWEYNTDLFDGETIAQMASHYRTVLAAAVRTPDRNWLELPLYEREEGDRLRCWGQGQDFTDVPSFGLHEWFATQAVRSPDAIAVTDERRSLSYGELNILAHRVASHLHPLGVGTDTLVALCIDRSVEMLVGMLAILKAGGAYVPLDPTYPAERLSYMLRDSGAAIVVTQAHLLESLPVGEARVVLLDEGSEAIASGHDAPLPTTTHPQQLAYQIYTSGSTGRPKGVQISHAAVVNFLRAMQQELSLSPKDVLLSVTTLSFDIAALELFLPLTVGARVAIATRAVAADGVRLGQLVASSGATAMQATPATWQMLLDSGWSGDKQLQVLCGGEALPLPLARALSRSCRELWNLYGPTEATIWTAFQRIAPAVEAISLGCALGNTQLYVLDLCGQLAPLGVPGELHVGGAGLARGYCKQPVRTAARFCPDPFSERPGARLYKTGDRVRYRRDGSLEFLGRIDNQVKLRGFRIELGEIESCLLEAPDIRAAVAVVREDREGDRRLVAYVIPALAASRASDGPITAGRNLLRSKLPAYMVPTAFVILEDFPLTPNGKVNRKAFPAPPAIAPQLADAAVLPQTPTQAKLCQIWTPILARDGIGIDDNFFDLGGHSLLATQIISRIRTEFGVELPLRSLFATPTIAAIAEQIERLLQVERQEVAIAIPTVPRDRPLPLSLAQQRLWIEDRLYPNNPAYTIPIAVRLEGDLDRDILQRCLDEVVSRHESLRTTFSLENGEPVQAIAPPASLAIAHKDLRHLDPSDREAALARQMQGESSRCFNLERGPLLQLQLLQMDEREYAAILTTHHIISDVWSMGVLVRELSALYTAYAASQPSPLPALPIQYGDFAVWQRQQLDGAVLQAQLQYWQQQLAGSSPLVLKGDRPRPVRRSYRGGSESFQLSAADTAALNQLCQQTDTTPFMQVMAALALLLSRHGQTQDVVIGTDVANRNRTELESAIGFFVNLLTIRTDLSGNPSVEELVQRVRRTCLDAYANQDIPFSQLVEELQPNRQANSTPLFQVLLVFQNVPFTPIELPGLTLSPMEISNERAKFDIALFVSETSAGLQGMWRYSADLFDAATIRQLSQHLTLLLSSFAHSPTSRIDSLDMLTPEEQKTQAARKAKRSQRKFSKFAQIEPKAIADRPLVTARPLSDTSPLPLLVEPASDDTDLVDWAASHRSWIEENLIARGGLLFRSQQLQSIEKFEAFARAICPQLFANYGDLPRASIGGKVYGSTPYPADKAILFHHESSHLQQWPMKICFYCSIAPAEGGETPIADGREIYRLLDPDLLDRFEQRQIAYTRHFIPGFDVSWQQFFNTEDRAEVEARCQRDRVQWEWTAAAGLKTRQIRPAIAQHPKTGDRIWFNQLLLHHVACLDAHLQKSLLDTWGEENLPRHAYYGDGSAIAPEEIAAIQAAYDRAQTVFPWQQGDVLAIDNMLAAHSRNPFRGPRKIFVAMGDMHTAAIPEEPLESLPSP
ncbi:non-ribosomal peptide synthetase [Synechococcus sp. PCC 7336]|uniref:non-ribosomal peptide synthetase n=1 Tax=Synechococcus sp. PCC 7336 TaxID=195250 RepID=UPI00034DDA50|nr:non-ribosomal peptide synthetase [Synechococcus sp. PCC 7336]